MKKWKQWLSAGLLAAAVCVGSLGGTVTADAAGYQRWSTVAEEERVQAAFANEKAKDEDKVHPNAWKQINGVCYNGSGEPIPGAVTWGMDVSEWQGKINWYKVKEGGIDFAFVRLSYGTNHMDKTYEYNMEQAELAGVPVGTYVYSLATTPKEALKEAKLAIEKMRGYKVSYPVVFDLEYSKMGELTKTQVSKLAQTFCQEVKKAGYYPMVYCNTNWYDNEVDWSLLSGYDVWIARYGDKIQAPSKDSYKYTIWQATDGDGGGVLNPTRGLVPGIPTDCNVDVDFGYVDYTTKILPRKAPVSGYVPTPEEDMDTGSKPDEEKDAVGKWKVVNGKKYFYIDGKKATGWQKISGKYYYFRPKTGTMYKNYLITADGKYAYVGENGARIKKSWIDWKDKRYYMDSTGFAVKGKKTINGKKYQFHSTKFYMYKNKRSITAAGDIYYYGKDGARCENGMITVKLDGQNKTFYFHEDGKAHKGWLTLDGKKYYFYKGTALASGTRAENITLTDSKMVVSVFDKNGVCIKQYTKKAGK